MGHEQKYKRHPSFLNDVLVNGGDSIKLSIEKMQGAFGAEDFKGFIVQGINEVSGEVLGIFVVSEDR